MNFTDKKNLENLVIKYLKVNKSKNKKYPLTDNSLLTKDILRGVEVLLSRQLTMSKITQEFENEFAKYIGAKHALMVNSGSSANLIAAFALANPRKKNFLKKGDEFLIPSLCWSTSLWPLVQAGLKPKFVDVNINNFNMNIDEFNRKLNKKIKAVMAVHVLGNSTQIGEVAKIAKSKGIFLIEDNNKYLGTFGDFGTYSFYYSHQITSGEGGMIVCNSKTDYDLIYSMRSHGWARKLKNNKKKDTSFNFINSGFNLRPLEVSAAIGLSQFKRLNSMINIRINNRKKIINKLINSPLWNNQFSFLEVTKNVKPSFFGLPILINKKFLSKRKKFFNLLKTKGIETRIIISGNFINQPSVKIYNLNQNNYKFPKAQEIENRGFFIGLHPNHVSEETLNYLEKNLLKIDKL